MYFMRVLFDVLTLVLAAADGEERHGFGRWRQLALDETTVTLRAKRETRTIKY